MMRVSGISYGQNLELRDGTAESGQQYSRKRQDQEDRTAALLPTTGALHRFPDRRLSASPGSKLAFFATRRSPLGRAAAQSGIQGHDLDFAGPREKLLTIARPGPRAP